MRKLKQLWSDRRRWAKRGIVVIALFIGIQWLSFAAGAGQVIDEETGKPLEGVFAMASWTSSGPGIAVSSTVCYAFSVTKTDNQGRFSIPSMSWNFNPLLWGRNRAMEFYLAGYETSPNDKPDSDVRKMRRFKGTVEKRLKDLTSVLYREPCVPDGERKAKLAPLYRAQFEEARDIATNAGEEKLVESLRLRYVSAEVGSETYTKMLIDGQIR